MLDVRSGRRKLLLLSDCYDVDVPAAPSSSPSPSSSTHTSPASISILRRTESSSSSSTPSSSYEARHSRRWSKRGSTFTRELRKTLTGEELRRRMDAGWNSDESDARMSDTETIYEDAEDDGDIDADACRERSCDTIRVKAALESPSPVQSNPQPCILLPALEIERPSSVKLLPTSLIGANIAAFQRNTGRTFRPKALILTPARSLTAPLTSPGPSNVSRRLSIMSSISAAATLSPDWPPSSSSYRTFSSGQRRSMGYASSGQMSTPTDPSSNFSVSGHSQEESPNSSVGEPAWAEEEFKDRDSHTPLDVIIEHHPASIILERKVTATPAVVSDEDDAELEVPRDRRRIAANSHLTIQLSESSPIRSTIKKPSVPFDPLPSPSFEAIMSAYELSAMPSAPLSPPPAYPLPGLPTLSTRVHRVSSPVSPLDLDSPSLLASVSSHLIVRSLHSPATSSSTIAPRSPQSSIAALLTESSYSPESVDLSLHHDELSVSLASSYNGSITANDSATAFPSPSFPHFGTASPTFPTTFRVSLSRHRRDPSALPALTRLPLDENDNLGAPRPQLVWPPADDGLTKSLRATNVVDLEQHRMDSPALSQRSGSLMVSRMPRDPRVVRDPVDIDLRDFFADEEEEEEASKLNNRASASSDGSPTNRRQSRASEDRKDGLLSEMEEMTAAKKEESGSGWYNRRSTRSRIGSKFFSGLMAIASTSSSTSVVPLSSTESVPPSPTPSAKRRATKMTKKRPTKSVPASEKKRIVISAPTLVYTSVDLPTGDTIGSILNGKPTIVDYGARSQYSIPEPTLSSINSLRTSPRRPPPPSIIPGLTPRSTASRASSSSVPFRSSPPQLLPIMRPTGSFMSSSNPSSTSLLAL